MTDIIDKFLSHRTGDRATQFLPFSLEYTVEKQPWLQESPYLDVYELEGIIKVRYNVSTMYPDQANNELERAKGYLKSCLYSDVLRELDKIALLVSNCQKNVALTALDKLKYRLSNFTDVHNEKEN